MRDETNVRDNAFLFCGNSKLGFKKIKEAMWKLDPVEGNSFSAYAETSSAKQPDMLRGIANLHPLNEEILQNFSGQELVSKKIIQDWADFRSERFLYRHARFALEHLVRAGKIYHLSRGTIRKHRTNFWTDSDYFTFVDSK